MLRASLFLFAVVTVIGLGFVLDPRDPQAIAEPENIQRAFGPANFNLAHAELDRLVGGKRTRLAASPQEWLRQEDLALALFDRYSLVGGTRDLIEAKHLIEAALAAAPYPSGPTLSSAQLALAGHDLDGSEQALERFRKTRVKSQADQASEMALSGDIAFQRGDLVQAGADYRQAELLASAPGLGIRRANHALWSGHPEDAARLLDDVLESYPLAPQDFARIALQRANIALAAGQIPEASRWIETARVAFPGYWLADAYAAQNHVATDDWKAAVTELTQLAARTQEPQLHDTLAGIFLHLGKQEQAQVHIRAARRLWQARLAAAPASYRLHAAEHFLDFGDPARALELSSVEAARRPFGEVLEVHASALIANDRSADALRWLDQVESAGYRSVSLYLARAQALRIFGRDKAAQRAVDAALQINPMAMMPVRKLLRFGHY